MTDEPRPTEMAEDFTELIDAWKAYYRRHWGEEP
jgi:hypothetical protein